MSKLSDQDYIYLRDLFESHTGIVFHDQLKLERLLNKRIMKLGIASHGEYVKVLVKDQEELVKAIEAITINETQFFRNTDQFEVIKQYFSRAIGKAPFRIWSVASSTGQEPCSLAMLAYDMGYKNVKILATDINKTVLDYAREGIYTQMEILRTEPDYMPYIKKYTDQSGRTCKIKKCIRDMISYRSFNLLGLTPNSFSSPLDMIICKNVFIYFTVETRERLYGCFHQLLKKDGALFMGMCESLPLKYRQNFKLLKKATCIKL